MPSPVFTLTNSASSVISSLSYGNIDAGSASAPTQVYFWNNFGGSTAISDAINVTLTTKTYNGLDSGDTVQNGQEVVTGLSFAEQCISQGDVGYTSIGGPTTAGIGSAAGGEGTIQGVTGGDAAIVNLTLSAPANVTPGQVQFLMRLNYSYV